MNKPINLLVGGLTLFAAQGCKAPKQASQQAEHPNIIYVFPDQYRNQAMGFWRQDGFRDKVNFEGDPVHTPNLDAFARESMVLSSAQSNCPLSSPHRGMLLTGMYPNKSGVPLNCNSTRPISSLREDAECIGDVFSKAGYDCAYFGKLHADFPTPNDPEHPGQYVEEKRPAWDAYTPKERRHGFNYWYSYGTFDEHKNPHYWDTDGKRHDPKEWSPLHESGKVISYLKNDGNVRDTKKPFFIMVGMNPPHSPYRSLNDCEEQDFNLYKDQPLDSLLIRPNVDLKMKKAESARYYFASVTGVDRAFGQILTTLKELGLDKNTVVIGSYHFVFEDEKVVIPEGMEEKFENLPEEYSHLYMAIEGKLAAVICIEDPLREEAVEVIRELRKAGLSKIVMMTGDSERTAKAIAKRVGVDEYYAEVLPEDKAEFCEREKAAGRKVIMIGDGINDSPALSAANVGIAISDGAEIAREIADITVGADNLKELVTLKKISNGLIKRISHNYHSIVGFNAGLIALGVAGIIMPTTSALLHNTSTLIIGLRSMQNLLDE